MRRPTRTRSRSRCASGAAPAGVTVSGGGQPATTGADGTATVIARRPARRSSSRPRRGDRHPEPRCSRSASARTLDDCPAARGERIVGSPKGDRIKGTRGADAIRARGGDDRIDLRKGGADKLDCGPGSDRVLAARGDADDEIASANLRAGRGGDEPLARAAAGRPRWRRSPPLAAGCGLGPGESSEGEATLTVTRDYGAEQVLEASESDPAESETVIRFLDREAEITTRYGGGFVQSIDGVAGEVSDGRSHDWFFFVNGIESPTGAAEVPVRGGDRIWWDYRDWTDAMRTPAVVGSWPEPFAQASAGADRSPVRVVCEGRARALRPGCASGSPTRASTRASSARAAPGRGRRCRCGCWSARGRRSAPTRRPRQLERGPATSGVFARFERRRTRLAAARRPIGRPGARLGAGAGLVAGGARRRRPADLARHRHRRRRRRARRRGCSTPTTSPTATRSPHRRRRRAGAAGRRERRMRSPIAYAPRRRRARPGGRRARRPSTSARSRSSPSSSRTRSCSPARAAAVAVAGLARRRPRALCAPPLRWGAGARRC